MDQFINPPEFLEEQREKQRARRRRADNASPSEPERDVLLFLLEHAPLEALAARRARDRPRRGLLLRPAGPDQDHERGLGQLLALHDHDRARRCTDAEIDRLRRPPLRHARHVSPAAQPYKLGIELFRDIEERWNKGPFGKEWDECDDCERKRRLGQGSSGWAGRRSSRSAASTTTSPSSTSSSRPSSVARAEALRLRLQRSATDAYEIESREFQQVKQAAAAPADQSRPADHRGRGRQLREPRRAVPRPTTSRASS